MTFKVLDAGGVLRTLSGIKVKDGTALRNMIRMKVMDADGTTLRLVATFVRPLTITLGSSVSTVTDPATRTTEIDYDVTAIIGGGLGPYSYSWVIASGTGWVIRNPSYASTIISGNQGSVTAGSASVTVTDATGAVVIANLSLLS